MMLENAVVGMIEGVSDENGKNDKFGFVGVMGWQDTNLERSVK